MADRYILEYRPYFLRKVYEFQICPEFLTVYIFDMVWGCSKTNWFLNENVAVSKQSCYFGITGLNAQSSHVSPIQSKAFEFESYYHDSFEFEYHDSCMCYICSVMLSKISKWQAT